MKRNFVFLSLALVMSASISVGAMADFQTTGVQPGTAPDTSRGISFEEFRARCLNPEQFDIQRQPQNIKVQCTDIRHEFVPAAPGDIPLPGFRRVVTALFADKFHVNADARDVPVFSKGGTCQRFKEVEKTLTIERALSCGEILGMKSSIDDLCLAALDQAKGANPKLVEVRDVEGSIIDTCRGLPGQQQGKPGSNK